MGFLGALLADDSVRTAILQHGAVFGGVSSGALAASYGLATLHGVHDMRHWYTHHMRRGYEAIGWRSTLAMGAELELAAQRYYNICANALGSPIPWLNHFPISVTEIPGFRPRIVSRFEGYTDFSQTLLASSYVPGMMGLRPWLSFDGRHMIDGYIGSWQTHFPDSYLCVSFLPVLPASLLCAHRLDAYEFDSADETFLSKAWPWGDPRWADEAFERGEADGASHLPELRAKLLAFLEA